MLRRLFASLVPLYIHYIHIHSFIHSFIHSCISSIDLSYIRHERTNGTAKAVEAERERAWAEENAAENAAALLEMRRFMPASLATLTKEQFEEKVKVEGG